MSLTVRQMEIAADLDRHKEDLYGLTVLNPKPPQCVAITPQKWYRPSGSRCPRSAIFVTTDGKELCRIHAIKWAEERL